MDTHHEHHHHGNRVEDRRLITGNGKYASDWSAAGQLYGYFLRSDRAHAEILKLDASAAREHPGVRQVLTGEDAVAAGYVTPPHSLTIPGRNGSKANPTKRPVLAHKKVRFVGEAVALVVADSAVAAQDAAELIEVEYKDLPCVVRPDAALAAGAPQLHDEVPGNLLLEADAGNEKDVEAAFAKAAHITRLKVGTTRVSPSPMEPRACLVAYDKSKDEYRFNVVMQGVTTLRKQISAWTKMPEEKLIFEARDVVGRV